MIAIQSQCSACAHLDRQAEQALHCNAFPGGIPEEIATNAVLHTAEYPGDHGIHLELIPLDVFGQAPGRA